MIPSLKRGCQLRWDLLFDGEMVPSAGVLIPWRPWGPYGYSCVGGRVTNVGNPPDSRLAVVAGLLIALAGWASNNDGPQHEGGEEIEEREE